VTKIRSTTRELYRYQRPSPKNKRRRGPHMFKTPHRYSSLPHKVPYTWQKYFRWLSVFVPYQRAQVGGNMYLVLLEQWSELAPGLLPPPFCPRCLWEFWERIVVKSVLSFCSLARLVIPCLSASQRFQSIRLGASNLPVVQYIFKLLAFFVFFVLVLFGAQILVLK
jgi:hypothetical protein